MDNNTRWFTSSNFSAPQLINSFGCLIDVLDYCLVNGSEDQVVTNVEISNKLATATFNTNHNFKEFQVVSFIGSPLLENDFRILSLTSNTITFYLDTEDKVITDTLGCKLAPLGWTKEFGAEHKAVYRAKDLQINPYFLRVDNSLDPVYNTTYSKFAKVGVLESCIGIEDISTSNQIPYNSLNPTSNWVGTGSGTSAINGWSKWYTNINSNAVSYAINETSGPQSNLSQWTIIGNDTSFYIIIAAAGSLNTSAETFVCTYVYGFGITEKPNNRITYLISHNRPVSVSTSEYFFNSNPLRYSWSSSIITLNNLNGSYSQDLTAYPNFYNCNKNSSMTTMRSGDTLTFSAKEADTIFYAPVTLHSTNHSYFGKFPLLNSLMHSHTLFNDFTTFVDNSTIYLIKKVSQGNVVGAFVFKIGEL